MCGRYVSVSDAAEVAAWFDAAPPERALAPDYNVAPTKPVYVVAAPRTPGPAARAVLVARWGLVPSWARDPAIGSRMINARAETVAEKPAFRRAFARRRCLIPANGYYEWHQPSSDPAGGSSGRARKQPYYIHRADDGLLALAGLYEWWHDRNLPEDDHASWLLTCTVVTTNAPDDLGRIHDRMPMIVEAEDWSTWLDRDVDGGAVPHLMRPASVSGLAAYPVSTRVNAVGNNGPELIAPAGE